MRALWVVLMLAIASVPTIGALIAQSPDHRPMPTGHPEPIAESKPVTETKPAPQNKWVPAGAKPQAPAQPAPKPQVAPEAPPPLPRSFGQTGAPAGAPPLPGAEPQQTPKTAQPEPQASGPTPAYAQPNVPIPDDGLAWMPRAKDPAPAPDLKPMSPPDRVVKPTPDRVAKPTPAPVVTPTVQQPKPVAPKIVEKPRPTVSAVPPSETATEPARPLAPGTMIADSTRPPQPYTTEPKPIATTPQPTAPAAPPQPATPTVATEPVVPVVETPPRTTAEKPVIGQPEPTSSEPPSLTPEPPAPLPTAPPVPSSNPSPNPTPVPSPNPAPSPNPTPVPSPNPMVHSSGVQTASVSVEIVGPESQNQGKPMAYEVVVRNPGMEAVNAVRIENEMPAGVRFLSATPSPEMQGNKLYWALGRVEPGTEHRFKVEVQADSECELTTTAQAGVATGASLKMRATQPRLTLTKTGPETAQVGDLAVFVLHLTNTGTGPATNVFLEDRLPPGLQHPSGDTIEAELGTLAPGASKTISLKTTAVQAGRFLNQAMARADDGLQVTAQAPIQITEPILTIRKTGPTHRFLFREAEFELEVANTGSAAATNVRVLDTLPANLDFVKGSDGAAYEAGTRSVIWMLGTLAPNDRRTLKVAAMPKAPGDFINNVVVTADRCAEVRAEAPLHVEGVPALLLEVVDLDDPVEVGNETTYEIRVLNQGSCASLGLQIIATVPPEMSPVSAEGPSQHRIQGQQVFFEPMPKLAAHADALYRVRVVGQHEGDARFKVQMSCDQLRVPVYEEESTRVYKDR